jgi:hypothetical protein
LIYPDPDDLLGNPTYAQFLSIPAHIKNYPLLAMPAANDGTVFPTSNLETPATEPSPYLTGATPQVFLTSSSSASALTLSPTMWEDMIAFAQSDRRWSRNHNLDSDRGFGARCWALAPGASVTSVPIQITELAYDGI